MKLFYAPASPFVRKVMACALGYLDFRFGHEPWRATRPVLAGAP